jgi:hypothetical protein
VRPLARLGSGGVISMPTSTGAVTVKVVEALFPERLADTVILPGAKALSIPCELMLAMAVLLEAQVTCDEISDLLPSENVPVAVSCVKVPAAPLPASGVIVNDDNVTATAGGGAAVRGAPWLLPPHALTQVTSSRSADARSRDRIISDPECPQWIRRNIFALSSLLFCLFSARVQRTSSHAPFQSECLTDNRPEA